TAARSLRGVPGWQSPLRPAPGRAGEPLADDSSRRASAASMRRPAGRCPLCRAELVLADNALVSVNLVLDAVLGRVSIHRSQANDRILALRSVVHSPARRELYGLTHTESVFQVANIALCHRPPSNKPHHTSERWLRRR